MRKIFLLLALLAMPSMAQTKVWKNTTLDGLWATAGNWSPSGVPTSTDTVIFHSDSSNATVTLGAARSAAAIRVQGTYSLAENATLDLFPTGASHTVYSVVSGASWKTNLGININTGTPNGTYTFGDIDIDARNIAIGTNTSSKTVIFGKVKCAYFNGATASATGIVDSFIFSDSVIFGNGTYGFLCGTGHATGTTVHDYTTPYLTGQEFDYAQSYYTTGNMRLYLRSATIDVRGLWNVNGSKVTINPGTSSVQFTGAGAGTILTGNKNLYDVVIAKTGGATATSSDSLLLATGGDLLVSSGAYVCINKTIRCQDYTVSGTSTIRDTGSLVYIAGNAAFGNSVTKIKGTGKYILSSGVAHTFASGTGNLKFDTVSVLGSTTFTGTDTMKLRLADGVLVSGGTHVLSLGYDIEGSAGNLDSLDGVTIDIPARDTVDYVYLKDITLNAADTLVIGANSVDGGGNSANIIFPAAPPTGPPEGRRFRQGFGFGF
jgi:hypothetical protein